MSVSSSLIDPLRPRLPRAIAGLLIAIIAAASLAALVAPQLAQRRVGSTRVDVITRVTGDPAAVRPGVAAPDFEWVRPDGSTTHLTALRGRPVVLNFWATWCVPCRAELPKLEAAAATRADLTFLEIDLDEDGDKVRGFMDSLGITHLEPLLDVGSALARVYGLSAGVPQTFFVDRDGVVRQVIIGEMDDARLASGLRTVAP